MGWKLFAGLGVGAAIVGGVLIWDRLESDRVRAELALEKLQVYVYVATDRACPADGSDPGVRVTVRNDSDFDLSSVFYNVRSHRVDGVSSAGERVGWSETFGSRVPRHGSASACTSLLNSGVDMRKSAVTFSADAITIDSNRFAH